MKWELRDDRAIYVQLIEHIKLCVVSGIYPPGSKVPSVRELANEAAVNPNTMQRALADLERDGLLFTQRTAGRFITEDANMIEKAKKDLAIEEIRSFLSAMRQIGYTKDDIFKVINQLEGEQ